MILKKDRLETEYGLKLLAKSSFVIFIGLLISKILTYVYRIIIARSFGPEIYGVFSLAIMISGWFIIFASLGLSEGLLRYIPWFRGKKEIKKINYLISITTKVSLFSSIFFSIILFIFSEYIAVNIFHSTELIIFLKVFIFLVPIYVFFNIFISILQAFEEVKWYSFIINILQNLVKVLMILFLMFLGFKINSIVISYFFGILVIFLVAYLVCKYKFPKLFIRSSLKKDVKEKVRSEFFSYSWPLIFSLAISNLFFWIDSFSIGYFKEIVDVGIYNSAIPIVMLLSFAPEIFIKLFFPLITKEFSMKNLQTVKELSQTVSKWIFILNFPIFLIMFLFPGVIINLLFGSTYLPATQSLKILIFGGFIGSLVWIPNSLLSMKGKSKLILINLILASLLNILLNIFLVPKYGINGAAFATTFSGIAMSLAIVVEAKYYLSISILKKNLIKIIIITIIPAVLISYFRNLININLLSLFLIGSFFFLVYIFLIFLAKVLDKNDFIIIKAIKRKFFSGAEKN